MRPFCLKFEPLKFDKIGLKIRILRNYIAMYGTFHEKIMRFGKIRNKILRIKPVFSYITVDIFLFYSGKINTILF